MKKNLKWLAPALLFVALVMPTALMATDPEPPCPTCMPGGVPIPTIPQK